jgi:outer membrane protein OmpA-like peptidoglycan-associated protein
MNPATRPFALPASLALAASAILSSCVTTPPQNANLTAARANCEQAAADPFVASNAAVELRQAHQELDRADQALRAGEPTAVVDHDAYLAQRRCDVAVLTGRAARADKVIADAQVERDRIVIAQRSREAEAQRAAAQQAQSSADQARADADASRMAAQQQLAAAAQARQDAANSQAQAAALQSQLADLQARQTERGMVLTLGDVLFDVDRSTLKPGADRTLDKVATYLSRDPSRNVLIEGYTDSTGSLAHNEELSQARADAVRRALVERGVAPSRIQAHGLGPNYEVASNDSAAGRQLNRRVEMVFSGENGSFSTVRQ